MGKTPSPPATSRGEACVENEWVSDGEATDGSEQSLNVIADALVARMDMEPGVDGGDEVQEEEEEEENLLSDLLDSDRLEASGSAGES